jgi:hypothetical protein
VCLLRRLFIWEILHPLHFPVVLLFFRHLVRQNANVHFACLCIANEAPTRPVSSSAAFEQWMHNKPLQPTQWLAQTGDKFCRFYECSSFHEHSRQHFTGTCCWGELTHKLRPGSHLLLPHRIVANKFICAYLMLYTVYYYSHADIRITRTLVATLLHANESLNPAACPDRMRESTWMHCLSTLLATASTVTNWTAPSRPSGC